MGAVVSVVADVGFHGVVLRSWAVVRNSCYGSFSSPCPVGGGRAVFCLNPDLSL